MNIDLSKAPLKSTCKKCKATFSTTFQQIERTSKVICPKCGETTEYSRSQVQSERQRLQREAEKKVTDEIKKAFKGMKNFRIK